MLFGPIVIGFWSSLCHLTIQTSLWSRTKPIVPNSTLMADDWGIGVERPGTGRLITRLQTTIRVQVPVAAGLVGALMLARGSGCWKREMFAKPLTKLDPENPQFSRSPIMTSVISNRMSSTSENY